MRPPVPSAPEAKKLIKTLAVESGLSGDIAKAKLQKALQDEDFPALGTPKAPQPSVAPSPAPKDKTHKSGTSKKAAEKSQDKSKATVITPAAAPIPPKAESRATDKRPTPGTLNIAAATKAAQVKAVDPSSAVDKLSADKEFPALPTPTATSVASPITRAAPKTLRVVPTPKTELPPTAPVLFAPSARTSAAIRPETPVSELISDSASIISASISASRTNSPPPSKVGSAPVRITTKSQQRKNRKEALKKESAEIASQPVKETDAEIGPIVGRKKKQKKEKEKMTKTTPTPAASRPGSPPPTVTAPEPIKEVKEVKETKEAKEAKEVTEAKEETSAYRSTAHETTSLTEVTAPARKADGKAKASDQYPNPQSVPTPAAVLHDLQKAGLLPANIDDLAFFKPTSWQADNVHHHASAATDDNAAKNVSPSKSIVSDEDQVELLSGNAVRKIMDGVRILLTPNGDCIRHLTEEEENRFLELQKSIAEMAGNPAAFVSARHEAGVGFSLIKGRAVPNGPPSYFPPAPGAFPSDPVNKIQREEAIYYINQYVLPRLNLNSRDMNLPRAMAGWSIDSQGKPHPSGAAGAAGAAAAASLAPWMYGANGMGGPSDTAAPELSFPGPSGSFDGMGDHPALAPYLDLPGGASQNIHLPPPEEIAAAMPSVAAHGGARAAASAFGNVPLMSMEDAEQALALARKETDKIDKTLQALMRKNKRLLTMNSSGGH